MGKLEKMKLTAFTDEKFGTKTGKEYVVMLNPESLKWDRRIAYSDQQAPDNALPASKYKSTPAELLSFEIMIDCTGVVDKTRVDLPSEIDELKKVVYDYNGKIHRPNFVGVHWGDSMTFLGVLTNFDVSYTLFKPNGTPLRAKVSLKFSSYTDPVTAAREEEKSSPDLTHIVDVVAGNSLPQLCEEILGDSRYFVQVARFNGLDKFRNLRPGSQLVFPPVVSESVE